MRTGEIYKDRYRQLKVLKSTDYVTVLLAEHVQLNSYWIIKKLNKAMAFYSRELDILRNIKHPGIPMITDVYDEENYLVMIREFAEGSPLDEYFHQEVHENQTLCGLEEAKVLNIGLQLCDIINFLHTAPEHPLIYRDIKPGNIIMSKDEKIKLIDFGIARYHDAGKNKDTEYLGTKGFASPEQFGFNQTDVRTDVFGIGACLYFLLTGHDLGKPPYKIISFREIRPDVDPDLEAIILKACQVNMDLRYQTVDELQQALSELHRQESSIKWQEDLRLFDQSCLLVKGIAAGVGATYTSLLIARQALRQGVKVLLIGSEQDLESLAYDQDSYIKDHLLYYNEIPILLNELWTRKNYTAYHVFKNIDLIIIDDIEAIYQMVEKSRQIAVLVASLVPWRVDAFEEVLLSPSKDYDCYLINGCSKKAFNELKASMYEVKMEHLPCISFDEIDKGRDDLYQLLYEWGIQGTCSKEKGLVAKFLLGTGLAEGIKH